VTTETRVLVADAHLPTRTGLRLVLERNGFEVVAEAADATGAVEAAARARPELCLVDADLPGGGIRAVGRIVARLPTDVVVLARKPRPVDALDAVRAGASGYLWANTDPEGIVRALKAVREGEIAIPRSLLGSVVDELRTRERGRRLRIRGQADIELTRRQAEVLGLLRDGLSTAEIAARLGLTPVTVRRHVALVLERLGAANRAEAVRLLDGVEPRED
jgi:DNA-binding NarL/FixJ family response regulator